MPLHIFLSTWVGSSLGMLDVTKGAKDVVAMVGFLGMLVLSFNCSWFKTFLRDRLTWLIIAYGLMTILLALVRPTDQDAEVLGVVYNLRFLTFFVYGNLVARFYGTKFVRDTALKLVILVAAFVALFGIFQYTFLPNDALGHVGYSRENGVLPAFFIDDKPDLERAMSTLRDPNSFGSYLIIIGTISTAFYLSRNQNQARKTAMWLMILSVLSLLYTFSRSAWLGFLVATTVAIAVKWRNKTKSVRLKKYLIGGSLVVIILGVLLFPLKNTYFIQNVVFHADEATVLEDPNQLRSRFAKESIKAIAANPLGVGPGTAGLASIKNDVQGVSLNENYYLQIAQEIGLVGLLIFLVILAIVGHRLLNMAKADFLALGLLASLVGLSITNLFVHIWSNEAVAYTWWGLAGTLILSQGYNAGIIKRLN